MKELFDVHCHMVPGVDDGAADLEESLAMLKMQHEDGVRKIIITPHYRRRMFETPAKKVHEQFLKLQEAAKKEYPDMSLYLGCELHSNMDLQDILEKRKYVTMAGSSYVLLEFSEGDSAQHIRERVYNVLSCGYEPIIAHVERYQAAVVSKARALLREYDGRLAETEDDTLLEQANEALCTMAKQETTKTLNKVLLAASQGMKNGYSRGDN